MCKGKPRRVGEADRRTMDDLRDESERLQRARPKFFQQQKTREVAKIAFVGDSENGPKALQVHIVRPHVVVRRHDEVSNLLESSFRLLTDGCQHCGLSRRGMAIYEIHDRALMLPDNRGVRLG